MINKDASRKELIGHIMFWCIYLFLRVTFIKLYPGEFWYRLGVEFIEVPLKVGALYFAIYYLIQRLLFKKQYVRFVIMFVVYVLAVMLLNRIEDYYVIYPLTESPLTQYQKGFWNFGVAFYNLIYIYPVVGLGASVYFIKGWYDNQISQERLQKEKLQAEMKLLKDQLHPHFLFNTLNNIYSLAQAESKAVPAMMLRLSDLLAFMLYDGSATTIPLKKELSALQDYIELERLRLGSRLQITVDVSGDVEGKDIAPLLLFPLLENCFKHGSHKTTEVTWIKFKLEVSENTLYVKIENSLPKLSIPKEGNKKGIGLLNVKKRLSYLYPSKHELEIQHRETFLVNLKIVLA